MSTIVLRSVKGTPLTNTEIDANFNNLNVDKLQSGNTAAALTITSATITTLEVTGHSKLEGVTSTGATGTGKLVFDTSPTLVTPVLGTPSSGNFSSGTFTWPTFNQNTSGTAAGLSAVLSSSSGGTGINNGGRTLTISNNNGTISFTSAVTLTVADTASVSGTNTGDQTSVSGNAGTATTLQTARSINGTSFNGSADITIGVAGSALTGTSLASAIVSSSLTSVGTLTSLTSSGAIKSTGTGGVGYSTGAGGTVVQSINKATAVTLDKITGTITLSADSLGANTTVSFTFTNSTIAATDIICLQHQGNGTFGAYNFAAAPGAGSATIYVRNITSGALVENIIVRFAVIKSVNA